MISFIQHFTLHLYKRPKLSGNKANQQLPEAESGARLTTKGPKKTLWSVGTSLYLGCDCSYRTACTYQNS